MKSPIELYSSDKHLSHVIKAYINIENQAFTKNITQNMQTKTIKIIKNFSHERNTNTNFKNYKKYIAKPEISKSRKIDVVEK